MLHTFGVYRGYIGICKGYSYRVSGLGFQGFGVCIYIYIYGWACKITSETSSLFRTQGCTQTVHPKTKNP